MAEVIRKLGLTGEDLKYLSHPKSLFDLKKFFLIRV